VTALAADRVDGREKTGGTARYTADTQVEDVTYAVFATGTIPRGRIVELDVAAAEAAPGVVAVYTHLNLPPAREFGPPVGQTQLPLHGDEIRYEGQPIAIVIAETLEQATHAARLVRAAYEPEPFETDFRQARDEAERQEQWAPPDSSVGDVEAALAESEFVVDETYATAARHHSPLETSATIVEPLDGSLLVHDTAQGVMAVRGVLGQALDLDPQRIRVENDFLGGGFGCKGFIWPHQILAALAARELGRPLKLVLTRAQAFTSHGYQPETEQRVTLGAGSDGRLRGIRHHSLNPCARGERHVEYAAIGTRSLYAAPAIETRHRVVPLDRSNPTPMRAPNEGPGLFGIECAMDELAYALDLDPLELRLRNYSERDPTTGRPFSSKELRACYEQAAERFGWSRRNRRPRSMRDGHDLVGLGMATASMQTFRFPAKARVGIDRDGNVLVEASTQDVGGGIRTVLTQVAAQALGVPIERVRVMIGDTLLPESPMTGGSSATLSVGSAILDAAGNLKRRLAEIDATAFEQRRYAEIVAKSGEPHVAAEGEWSPAATNRVGEDEAYAIHGFGAVFVEVRVDEALCIPRVRRAVAVYSAGRIINPKTARSQMIGGISWGIGQALLESSEVDHRLGRFLSKNLAGYLVPVSADVPAVEVDFVDEVDPHASALGARGIGELGATGIGPAIANAVFHATGVRVRDLPIRPEHLLGAS
jgi:xanthine dehydrogenase YagR molybdenum-binding subunit